MAIKLQLQPYGMIKNVFNAFKLSFGYFFYFFIRPSSSFLFPTRSMHKSACSNNNFFFLSIKTAKLRVCNHFRELSLCLIYYTDNYFSFPVYTTHTHDNWGYDKQTPPSAKARTQVHFSVNQNLPTWIWQSATATTRLEYGFEEVGGDE